MTRSRRRTRRVQNTAKRKLKVAKKIYDNVHGYIDITEDERQVIDTPVFQRLRRIAHLGLADFVYPGATHTRFSHSLGSMFVMNKIASRLVEDEVLSLDDVPALRLAALLHDIGHYPFSHVFESAMKNIDGENSRHENIGEFIVNESSLNTLIRKICDPEIIGAILRKKFREQPLFQYLVSSSLDVDKIDYLQRDSLHTGVAYGAFDAERLLACLTVDSPEKPNRLVVTRKGRLAVEDMLIGRFHMFQSVYYHKTVVAFELMLQKVVESLVRDAKLPDLEKLKQTISKDETEFAGYDDNYAWRILWKAQTEASMTGELTKRLFTRSSLKLANEALTLSTSETPPLYKEVVSDELSEWLSRRSGVPKEWILYKEYPEITFLEPDHDVTVWVETSNNSKPIIEEETSIIKKLWESRLRGYRVYTKDESSKQRIERALPIRKT